MIRCLIVDDEPLAIRVLEHHIAQIPDVEVVATTTRPLEVASLLHAGEFDLLFVDVEMPALSGTELVASLSDPPAVVFTTAHREFAVEGFDLAAVDYLVKPIGLPRLAKAIDRVRSLLHGRAAAGENPTASSQNARVHALDPPVVLSEGRRLRSIQSSSIQYVESLGDYVTTHSTSGRITSRLKISELADELASHGFLRVHRSFIVNPEHVDSWSATELTIGQVTIPVSRSYRLVVQQAMERMGRG